MTDVAALMNTENEFKPAFNFMDDRFVNNTGGNMSNMVSRAIYELIEPEETGEATLNLEIYHKDNTEGVRELHGNIILHSYLNDGDNINLGWMFSPEKDGSFDGLDVQLTYNKSNSETPMTARDIWQETRPFTADTLMSADLSFDTNQHWTIVGPKSSISCEGTEFDDRCQIKVHFLRKFDTEDSKDYKIEKGLFKGYEVVSYYRITNADQNIADRGDFAEKDYILMGATNLAKTAFMAAVATYAAFAF